MNYIEDKNNLFKFAFCGKREEVYEQIHLKHLSDIAETEKWCSQNEDPLRFDILFYYILRTFEIISIQDKIIYNDKKDFAIFNTGLLTKNGEEIFGYFVLNTKKDAQKWYFKGFTNESNRCLSFYKFKKPVVAKYDDDINEFHFDSTAEIELNTDHIFNDHWQTDNRFPSELKELGKSVSVCLINSAFEVTKKRIKRNLRLVVPQYYENKITFLLPLNIPVNDEKFVVMALAVEKINNGTYRANTIFNLETAYKKARLITRPESNWLINK